MISFWTALKRGMNRVCPSCGQGSMFQGYLQPADGFCPCCGIDFSAIRADDIASYFTIVIVGHLVLPFALLIESFVALSTVIHLCLWIPATLILVLILLPFVKGAGMGVTWWSRQPGAP